MDTSAGALAAKDILSLPHEIRKEIFSHCSQCDLICLSLVCRKFHELAAAQLYRNFHIVFPDEDDPSFDSPIDGLAGGLDTFVTSEYNYAKHLRDLSLDTLSAGEKAEIAYKPYMFNVSCGKFMNTLLLLTLRKAKHLDTFKWNIRVELSRPVYKALHQIKTLKNLHVRMQSGPSLYEKPPSLPYYSSTPATSAAPLPWSDVPALPPPTASFQTSIFQPPPASSFYSISAPSAPALPFGTSPGLGGLPVSSYNKLLPRGKLSMRDTPTDEPPTISGFKNLERLSVLDIDSLDIIPEIQACVRNSGSTLKKLKLSFSDSLGMQARKPCLDVDPNESDEDEFQVPMNTHFDDGSGPAKAFRAKEERKAQESVLSRIFGIEPLVIKRSMLSKRHQKKDTQDQPLEDRKKEFLAALQKVSTILSDGIQFSPDESQKGILDIILKASRLYVEDVEKELASKVSGVAKVAEPSDEASSHAEHVGEVAAGSDDEGDTTISEQQSTEVVLFTDNPNHAEGRSNDLNPDDIDIIASDDEQIEKNDDATSQRDDVSAASTSVPTPAATSPTDGSPSKSSSAAPSIAAAQAARPNHAGDADAPGTDNHSVDQDDQGSMGNDESSDLVKATEKKLESLHLTEQDIQHQINVVEAEIEDAEEGDTLPALDGSQEDEDIQRQASDYARGTRGISLQSLSIHLIPVKASVLGRSIDLRTLTRISLLNVGNQAPIWSLMSKENRLQPLVLRKIFTDNVSTPFLHLVSQLERVEELFMLERSPKYKPESFAPSTTVTLDHIRRAILKKHMHTMERLMIKNQADASWDLDEKTTQLVCKRGKVLEELAVNMGIRAIHTLLQHLSGLMKLRALHIITFRSDDTCLSVMRETRRFIVDTVSHYPKLQLEYISIGDEDHVERIVRKSESTKKSRKSKGKAKEATKLPGANAHLADPFPILPVDNWEDGSSSDDDEDDAASASYTKLDLYENIPFYDVWGVRIFKKEIMGARL
ncbi:hypothetical protein BX600DRAFT_7847 [Xylariales sp. PMI_506]|nr:hypothetical protein BX600DRAFT_7847 [Xylariales sp. PMI_506]